MHRITPFGNPGVNGYVLLSPAYRSLSRPSSPDSSQASAIDLYSLGHIIFSALFLRAVRVYCNFQPSFSTGTRFKRLFVNASEDITHQLPSFLRNFKDLRKNHFVIFTYRVFTCSPKGSHFLLRKKTQKLALRRP